MSRFLGTLLLLLLSSIVASSQTLYMYSSWTIDDNTGNVALYARTSTDYTAGYYYNVKVQFNLFLNSTGTYACNLGTSQTNMDAEQTCSYTVPLGTGVDFTSVHEVDAAYYWYQVYPSCSSSSSTCSGFADYYGFSLLGTDGAYYDNQTFAAPGQSVQVSQQRSKSGSINRTGQVGACQYPTGETCSSQGFDPQNQYIAQYLQALQGGGQFNQRIIQEYLTISSGDSCWNSSMGFSPMSVPASNSWLVSYIKNLNGYLFNYSNGWGYDDVGIVNDATRVGAYIGAMRAKGGGNCGINFNQNMYMKCGSSGGQYYVTNNPLSVYFAADYNSASQTSSRAGVNQTRSIP